jgi:hypothetical protein
MTKTKRMTSTKAAANARLWPHYTRAQQRRIDQLVMGCMRRDARSLKAVLSDKTLLDARSSLGFAPLFGACYLLWPEAVRDLLNAGADPFEVGLGSAFDAVETGLRDAGRDAQSKANAVAIAMDLKRYGMDIDLSLLRGLRAA